MDGNAATIVDTVWPMVQAGAMAIPRGGYLIRRVRGRIKPAQRASARGPGLPRDRFLQLSVFTEHCIQPSKAIPTADFGHANSTLPALNVSFASPIRYKNSHFSSSLFSPDKALFSHPLKLCTADFRSPPAFTLPLSPLSSPILKYSCVLCPWRVVKVNCADEFRKMSPKLSF